MGAESIDPKGFEKLLGILKDKEKDMRRFKEGFLFSLERNVKLEIITEEESITLITKFGQLKF